MAALGVARGLFRACRGITSVDHDTGEILKRAKRLTCSLLSNDGQGAERLKTAQFADAEVQDILTRIAGLDLNKVFQPVKQELKPPKYRLLTDTQLEEAAQKAQAQAKKLLKMPPVLPERKPIKDVLCEDKMLEGMDKAKYVFTDITYNIPHRERFIVVREPSGTLRKASWKERDRLVQVYFPKKDRKLTPPPMFKEENLKVMFGQNRHQEVLNYSLVQFEPDSAEFKRVHALTYEDIDKHGKYVLLWSSRLFGGLVWYLVSSHRIDGLLADMLQRERLEDAVNLVHLFNLVHPQSDCALQAHSQQANGMELLKIYADSESQRAGFIKLALQVYEQTTTHSSA
ncbi:small ribosomal subunit protein mS22 [Salminus brasiliensis]|uniref:small ribosomal subunit protein mS22 n=1 Tax=Salminus brasiliensis TaxID=930266 RepID=UPI003B83249A